jgi:hypothetical protein
MLKKWKGRISFSESEINQLGDYDKLFFLELKPETRGIRTCYWQKMNRVWISGNGLVK